METIKICIISVPKSGGEYAYLHETFAKQHKFWGPLPAFICSWVYVVILRPAEVSIIIMTFSSYTIQPFSSTIGLDKLTPESQLIVIKLFSLLTLGNNILAALNRTTICNETIRTFHLTFQPS